jgi:hypothetical protein
MNRQLPALMLIGVLLIAVPSCRTGVQSRNRSDELKLPRIVLWAWERPEHLEFLDPQRFAVAFLAQTLTLKADEVVLDPRRQPLKVSPDMKLIAVTRIESQKITGQRPTLSESQRQSVVTLVLKTLDLGKVSAIQIDFDVASSEREFYRSLLVDLRQKLSDNIPLSMTALASFCIGDRWLADLPVDEAVPMIFRMGADNRNIRSFLAGGNDFREPICGRSYGVSVDEPLTVKFDYSRRLYLFSSHAWSERDLLPYQQGEWK